MSYTTTAVIFLEFYREDGSWIGAAAAGVPLHGEFTSAYKVVFENRVEIVTHDEEGNLVD